MATITVTLGKRQQDVLDNLVKSGRFASQDEALQAGIDALEREESGDLVFDDALRAKVQDAVSDPRRLSLDEVRQELKNHSEQAKAARRGA